MALHVYDLVVIGDHLGGLAAAALAAKRGQRVLLFEDTGNPVEERPMEYLNAICGGPEKEAGLGRFFHDLGLSPFGPLGDDRIHFRPLHPPLQVVLPRHRVNIYQDRVARNWEMEREFGNVEKHLDLIQEREEAFREKLFRYRSQRPEREGSVLGRRIREVSRIYRLWNLHKEAEKETFSSFLSTLTFPAGLADVLAGQAQGVARVLPRSLPWAVGLRAMQVLQGGLFQNASGQSGVLNGLKEVFLRSGGECRPLLSLEGVEISRAEAVGLSFAQGNRVQGGRLVVDLPLDRAQTCFEKDTFKGFLRKGIDHGEEEWHYGLMHLSIRRDWRPECMGRYLVVDPTPDGGEGITILLALQPGDAPSEADTLGMEVLGLSRKEGRGELGKENLWRRLRSLMPFLEKGLAGEVRFRSGSFTRYQPHRRGWWTLKDYYQTGRRPRSFRTRQVTFLRNDEYVGTGLAEGILTGIWALE